MCSFDLALVVLYLVLLYGPVVIYQALAARKGRR